MEPINLVSRCARWAALLAVALNLPLAAQTVYLRTPGTGFCRVTSATNATPIRLTISNASVCGINADGQIILVTEVRGNTAANIHLESSSDTVNLARKVANLSGNQFDLQDLAGNPVAANGAYLNGGRVGLASQYTLKDHPRMYLDGPAGAVTASLSSTAPGGRAHVNNLPFTALKEASTFWGSGWGDDRTGSHAAGDALRWMADGDAGARQRALTSLTNITQVLGTPACDETKRGCLAPASSVQDYPTQYMERFTQAYSIMRGQMSPADRANFLKFVLTDLPWNQGGIGYTGATKTKPAWKVSDTTTSGTISAPTNGTAVTGTGTHFLTDVAVGDIIVMPHSSENVYAQGYRVASVDSDTSLTLAEPVSAVSVPAGSHYMVGPAWNDSLYGLLWFTKHYDITPMCGGAATVYPYTLLADCSSTYGNQAGIDQSGTNNLVLARFLGYYSIGLTTCGDDPQGCLLLSLANEFFVDAVLPRALTVWTGFSQSNPGYHVGRMYNIILSAAVMTKNSLVEQPDYLAGTKIVENGARWGYAAVLPVLNLYLSNAEFYGPYDAPSSTLVMPLLSLYSAPTSNASKYYKYWLTNQFTYDQSYIRYNGGEYTWFHFLYNDPAITPVQPPTTTHFTSTSRDRCIEIYGAALCPSDEGRYVSISQQNWNTDRTYLAVNATSYSYLDHGGDDIGVWPFLVKNGRVLLAGDSNSLMGARAGRGYIELGGTADNLRIIPSTGPTAVTWAAGDDDYMVSNINITSTYKPAANASAVHRQFIHLKSGSQDYIVDHASVATSSAVTIRGLQQEFLNGCGTPASTTCIDMNPGTATVSHTQTGPDAKLISKALGIGGNVLITTQDGSPSNGSYPGGDGKTFRWYVCPTSNGSTCTDASSAEWVVVHKPSTSTTETMPPVVQGSTGVFRIVEIQDPAFPKVAVFTAAGATATAANFTTSHAGTGQYVVSGLEPGPYSITRNGTPLGIKVAAVGQNSIGFDSDSGSISIFPGPPPLTISTESLPNAAQGKPYSATISAISSTTPYTWQLTAGTLCAGLTFAQAGDQAVISGSAQALETCTFTVVVTNATSTETDTRQFSITVVAPGPAIAMASTFLPAGRLADSYVGKLRAIGGTLPLAWSISAGTLCPGLLLDALTGEIRGVPTEIGLCTFTVRATDIGQDFVERQFFIAINENQQVPLFISAARASQSSAVLQFGRRGLDFADACSLVLRLGGPSGTELSSLTSATGPSRRILVADGLPSGQDIHAAVTCGTQTAAVQFTTGFTPPAPAAVKLVFHPPAGTPPASDLVLFYDTSPLLLNSLVASCSAQTCIATISSVQPVLYWRGVYRDSSANVLATTGLHRIAPR